MKKVILLFVLALFVWQTATSLKRPKFSVSEVFYATDTTGIKFDEYHYINDTTVSLYFYFYETVDSVLVAVSNVKDSVVFKYLNSSWNFSNDQSYVLKGEIITDEYTGEAFLNPENQESDTLLKYFGLSSFNPVIALGFISLSADEINSMGVEAIFKSAQEDLLFYEPESSLNINLSSVPELADYFDFLRSRNKFDIAARKDSVKRLLQQTRINYKAAYFNFLNTIFRVPGTSYALLDEYDFDNKLIKIHLFLDDNEEGVYVATIVSKLDLSLAEKLFDSELLIGDVYFYVSQNYGNKSLGVTEDGDTKWRMPDLYHRRQPEIIIGNDKIKISLKTDELAGQLWPDSIDTDDWEQNENFKPFEHNERLVSGEIIEIFEPYLSLSDSILGDSVVVERIEFSDDDKDKQVVIQAPVSSGPAIDEDVDVVFVVVESMPAFPGGDAALMKYLSENIKYPVIAQECGIQGRVICQFVVNRDGSIVDIEVVRSVDKSLDNEAIRVISNMPKWIPGKQRGKIVRVKYTLPVNFRFQ